MLICAQINHYIHKLLSHVMFTIQCLKKINAISGRSAWYIVKKSEHISAFPLKLLFLYNYTSYKAAFKVTYHTSSNFSLSSIK